MNFVCKDMKRYFKWNIANLTRNWVEFLSNVRKWNL